MQWGPISPLIPGHWAMDPFVTPVPAGLVIIRLE